MPKQLNADAQAYDKEYDAFLKQLEEFHQQRGTSFKRLPCINGKGIDLYLLYVVVTARGGWQKVNSRNEWEDILEDFRLPAACVNSATALKHIYIRYLDSYERLTFFGEEGDERTNDGDEDESRSLRVKRSVRSLNIVPLTYNTNQHNVSESVRQTSGMCAELYKGSIYERLALSLSSPLPNEHDFAFNMCTLLSNEGKHTLQLPQCPRLIEFMLAHTGVFRDSETRNYFISSYKEAKGKSLVQFWIDSVENKRVLDLLSPDSSIRSRSSLRRCKAFAITKKEEDGCPPLREGSKTPVGSVCEEVDEGIGAEEVESSEDADSRNEDERGSGGKDGCGRPSSPLSGDKKEGIGSKLEQVLASEVVDLRLEPEDTEIFHLGRDLGLLDSEGTRISQVLHILRNLSFEESNIPILANSNTCLRFLVLCVCSRWGGLSVGALDTLGNIAAEISMKDPSVDSTSALLLSTVSQGVSSQDRALVLRSLEVLNRLAMNDFNEEILSSNVEQMVYDQICRFLTIHDIMLLIYTLESLYSLSSMGAASCNAIVRAKGAIQTLISLLTVEAQSYGPEACIGMKVVETVTGIVSESETGSAVTTTNQISNTSATTTTTNPAPNVAVSVVSATQTPQHTQTPIAQSTPTVTKVLPKTPTTDVQKRVVPPEVEEFVTSWVMKHYDASPSNAIEQAIVYRHFAASMHALGRKQGLNPVLLSNCVRKVFGTGVGPSRRPVEDGTEKWHYNGIKRKEGVTDRNTSAATLSLTPIIPASSLPIRSPQPPSEGGSILKAQLSAPLRNTPSPVRVVQHQSVVGGVLIPSPTPSSSSPQGGAHAPYQSSPQAAPRSDNSSLIKSLLASKVTRNIQKTETTSENSSENPSCSKALSFNGICNELIKAESEPGGVLDPKRVTSFEGILQNGIKDEKDNRSTTPAPVPAKEGGHGGEKKNLLADLLERTVGGDVLNGVVEKDLRITEKGIQVVTHVPYSRVNGPPSSLLNGPVETALPTQGGTKRPATPDTQGGPLKRLAIEDPRNPGSDSRITLYVSQNGSDGEVLSQGHQVIINQGTQGQVVAPQGQVILQRSSSQGNVLVQQSPQQIISPGTPNQIITQRSSQSHPQVIYTTQSQAITSGATGSSNTTNPPQVISAGGHTQVISAQGSPAISSTGGQVLQQVIAHGQGGQKVILHGGQLGQVLGGQVIIPQGGGQKIFVQGGSGLSGQVIMQGVSVNSNNQNPVIVQGTNGHNQVLMSGSGTQGQVLLQGGSGGAPLVVSQGQAVMNSSGQTMIFTGAHGAQQVVLSGGSQGQGQMLVQSGGMGNAVFLAPQHQGGQGAQKTLIILPNPKMVVSSNQPQSSPVVLPRQVMQVVSSSAAPTAASHSTHGPTTVRTIKTTAHESSSAAHSPASSYSPNTVSVQVHTGGVAPPPSGPTATPVTQNTGGPHIPAPQVLSSGIARRPKTTSGLHYLCEWRGCHQVFSTPGQVYHHACKVHCPSHLTELTCQWVGCDTMVRKRFSAMTHIHDRHCNEQLLQILALRRQQIASSGKTDIPVPQTPPPHPGYAPNAAFHAIKRHALEVINQRDAVEKEGPVTKSIRLTAALILRNLVIYSNSGKKLLKGYESELANVAISSMESSRTVGQILYDIHLTDHQAL